MYDVKNTCIYIHTHIYIYIYIYIYIHTNISRAHTFGRCVATAPFAHILTIRCTQ